MAASWLCFVLQSEVLVRKSDWSNKHFLQISSINSANLEAWPKILIISISEVNTCPCLVVWGSNRPAGKSCPSLGATWLKNPQGNTSKPPIKYNQPNSKLMWCSVVFTYFAVHCVKLTSLPFKKKKKKRKLVCDFFAHFFTKVIRFSAHGRSGCEYLLQCSIFLLYLSKWIYSEGTKTLLCLGAVSLVALCNPGTGWYLGALGLGSREHAFTNERSKKTHSTNRI